MIRPIHPFPARMAPELAIHRLRTLTKKSVVLDPMAGSGTVLRQATELGHRAIGFDMDPLAVLMARVWTTPVPDTAIERLGNEVVNEAKALKASDLTVPWIDNDEETATFVRYWFGLKQREDLYRLSLILNRLGLNKMEDGRNAADVLRIALSRTIITKERGASLGRDVSHS